MSKAKLLRIEGTNIALKIVSCDGVYREGKPDITGCPCFFDGHGYEYHAVCQLTGIDGNGQEKFSYQHKPSIMPSCPLPDFVSNEEASEEMKRHCAECKNKVCEAGGTCVFLLDYATRRPGRRA